MRILVTGGTGYLGRALADRLQHDGHKVRVLDVRKGDLACEYIEGDILSDESVNHAVKGVDCIFHVAAIVGFWKGKRAWQRQVNVEGTLNLLRVAQQQSGRAVPAPVRRAGVGYHPAVAVASHAFRISTPRAGSSVDPAPSVTAALRIHSYIAKGIPAKGMRSARGDR